MNYIIKSPETKQEWEKYFAFRWKLLRKPWNMPLSSLKDSLENDSEQNLMDEKNEISQQEERLATDFQLSRAIDLIKGLSIYKDALEE